MSTDYEKKQQFYQQFNTVVHNHQEWLKTPEALLEVMQDAWKGQAPIVRIESPDDVNSARRILDMIRERHK